jgi:hypothetical protein
LSSETITLEIRSLIAFDPISIAPYFLISNK